MSKYYFRKDDELCYRESDIIDQMKEDDISELVVYEAKRELGTGSFFCLEYSEVMEVGESCGIVCEKYSPLNGKNGRCKHYGYVYEQTDKTKTFQVK